MQVTLDQDWPTEEPTTLDLVFYMIAVSAELFADKWILKIRLFNYGSSSTEYQSRLAFLLIGF